jgi:hypothetical protein
MKRRHTPQEKKKLAYEKDHYVSGGESRHAFRKNWPKKKATLNQKHRHNAAQKLSVLEKLGDIDSIEDSQIEVTAEELRKLDPRTKLFKFGVKSLREYVARNIEERKSRAWQRAETRKLITARCDQLIATLENNPNSPTARAFLRDVAASGGWGWDFWLFLRWYPEHRPRLQRAWSAATKVAQKAEMKRRKKEAEKQQTKALLKSIQTQATACLHAKIRH